MARWFAFLILVEIALAVLEVHGSVFVYQLNTDSGFCETSEYGRIPVGGVGYNDETCQRFSCSEGLLEGVGCGRVSSPAGCRVVEGSGHYPDCCPTVQCGSENESDD